MLRKITRPLIYPAGPEVFNTKRSDLEYCVNWANTHNFDIAHPGRHPQEALPTIYDHCVRDAQRADVVLLDMNPFRGNEPDSGTSVEAGIALQNGTKMLGYKEREETMPERVGTVSMLDNGLPVDANGYFIEPKDLNLMLHESIKRNGKMFYGPRDQVFDQMAAYVKNNIVGHYRHEDRLIGRAILPPDWHETFETITPGFKVDLTRWAPIIEHKMTRRLREIKQLGSLFWQYPDATHTRYAHIVLSHKFTHDTLQHLPFDQEDNGLVLAYNLLHDHGHTAYSHDLEKITQLDQMEAAKQIITEPSFAEAIRKCGVDISKLLPFFDKKNPLRAIVSDKVLGTEKMAYLLRDGIATGKGGYDNIEVLLNSTVFENGKLGIDENNATTALKQINLYHSTYAATYFGKEARLSQRIYTLLGQIAIEQGTLPKDWWKLNDLWYDFFNIRAEENGNKDLAKLGRHGIVDNSYKCIASLRLPGAEILESKNGQLISTINEEDYTRFLAGVPIKELKTLEERLCANMGLEPLDILVTPGGALSKLTPDDTLVFRNGSAEPVWLLADMFPEQKEAITAMTKRQAISVRFYTRDECMPKIKGKEDELIDLFKKSIPR